MDAPVRILYVDDTTAALRTRSECLTAHQAITVVTDTDIDRGVRRLSTEQFDCVLSGVTVPTRDGIAFLEAVREIDSAIPCILLSSGPTAELISSALAAGVTEIVDPVTLGSYAQLADRLLDAAGHPVGHRQS